MKIKQAPVLRFFFPTEAEAQAAFEALEELGIFGDLMSSAKDEPAPWKVIFAERESSRVREALRRVPNKPKAVEVFDPAQPWELGFKSLTV